MAERLNKDSFQEKVLNASGLAIADFYSDSCIPCKKLSRYLQIWTKNIQRIHRKSKYCLRAGTHRRVQRYVLSSTYFLQKRRRGRPNYRGCNKHKIEEAIEKNK